MSDLIEIYARRLQARNASPYTISTRCRVLRRADRILPQGLDDADGEDIIDYLASLDAPWTKATYFSHLRGYYTAMVRAGRLPANPTDHVDRPTAGDRIPDPVEDWELAAALARSPDQPWRPATILAAYAGLRCCELCELNREDVTRERVHVRRGKGGKGRYVPTHPAVWDLVSGLPAGRIIVSGTGEPITADQLTKIQHRHWRAVDLPTVHMHRFRHWFGTTLADNGVAIEVIQELMGHVSIDTTRGYVRVSVARQQSAMAALPTIGAPAGSWPAGAPGSVAVPVPLAA